MKSQPIPEELQIRSMLDGSVYELVCTYRENPSPYNVKQYLSVDRARLVDYLTDHPGLTMEYFQKYSKLEANHETGRIWQEDSSYVTAWMDHDQKT